MKFENIKVGDEVLITKEVNYGFLKAKKFFVPSKVIKVTKTLFELENGKRYRKQDGSGYGNHYENAWIGGEVNYGDQIVKDQTEEVKSFIKRLEIEGEIMETIDTKVKLKKNSGLSEEELHKAQDLLKQFIEIVEK